MNCMTNWQRKIIRSGVKLEKSLLNLQIIQEAYSHSTLSGKNKYFDIFNKAGNEAMKTGRRFYGEIDPEYDY